MNLSSALSAARSSLSATATQTSVISRNVGGANEALYTRKTAVLESFDGGVRIASITRTADATLFQNMLGATSTAAGDQAIVDGLTQLEATVGDPSYDRSPAAMLSSLRDAVQAYSTSPGEPVLANQMLNSAQDVADTLRTASTTVQQTRVQADADMASSVGRVNELLARLEAVNAAVVSGTQRGEDITGQLDTRDRLVSGLSEELGIRVSTRAYNDLVIHTDSGVTLFETRARPVTLKPTLSFQSTTVGNAVYVDGVPVVGPQTTMPVKSGRLVGLAAVRDDLAVTYQGQLDEVARGLIEVFAESDQNDPPSLPTIPGLFTWSGAPALPSTATLVPGLAADLFVNPNADPEQGGVLQRLRDGGIGDPAEPAYVSNPSGMSGFSERLQEMLDALGATRSFDPAVGANPTNSLIGFASSSVSWLEATRQDAAGRIEYQSTLRERASEALSNATGVNIEEEMTIMLGLERSYQASAKLLSTVDDMLATLFRAVG